MVCYSIQSIKVINRALSAHCLNFNLDTLKKVGVEDLVL